MISDNSFVSDLLSECSERCRRRDFRISRNNFPYTRATVYVAFFAFILRLIIASSYLNTYDTEWNIMWGVQLGDGFFSAHSHVDALDYPPLYFYPLWLVGRLISVQSIGGYPPFRMLAIKFVPCLTDSLTCVVLYKAASIRLNTYHNKTLGLLAASLWAVNPAAIFNCACWGQTDCVLMFMAAMLLLALDEKRVTAAGVLWGAMCSTKLQGLYLTPVVGMEVLTICFGSLHPRDFSLSAIRKPAVMRFVRFVIAAVLTMALIYLPFMLGSGLSSYHPEQSFFEKFIKPVSVYSEGVAKYPYSTFNADNIYMLMGLNGVNDNYRVLPGISASMLGSLFLLTAMAAVIAVYIFGKRGSQWLAGFMFMDCVFMLTCRQHERYQILTLVLLMGAFTRIADKRILTLFSLNSMVIFFNQFRVLSRMREKSGWWHYYMYADSSAGWMAQNGKYATVNSLLGLMLFTASMVYVFRYFFDERSDESLISRGIEAVRAKLSSGQ